jgi:hypothetical protein
VIGSFASFESFWTHTSILCGKIDTRACKVVLAGCMRKIGSHGTPSSFESHMDDKASSGIPDGLRSFPVPHQENPPMALGHMSQKRPGSERTSGSPYAPQDCHYALGPNYSHPGGKLLRPSEITEEVLVPPCDHSFVVRYEYSKPKGSKILH